MDYPDFVEASQQNFQQVVEVVQICQQAAMLKTGPAELTAVSVWGAVHGLIMLVLEGQVSHTVLEQYGLREMLLHTLSQMTKTPLSDLKPPQAQPF